MKFERISLENFRQYYGKQRIEFARDSRKNVTVIHGVNGAGKTSLFLAINWCLYGKLLDNVKVVDNVGELISKEAVHRATKGEIVTAKVEITFSHNGERYTVRRVLQGTKQGNGTVSISSSTDDVSMMQTRLDGQAEKVNNPSTFMNAILPVNVREYFLFDGEKIDNFAKPEASDQVKDAIYLVLKLELLDRARRHLEALATEYRKELKKVSDGELRDLLEKDEKARAAKEKAENRISEVQHEIESARRKIADIDQKLRESENTKIFQQQRDRILSNLKLRHTELDNTKNQIRELATGAYIVIARPAIDRALAILEEKRERGEIPSSIRQQFVQDLIAQMKCICGRPFTDGSPEHKRLLSLMDKSIPSSLEDEILNTNAVLRTFVEQIQRQKSSLDTAMKQHTHLTDVINALDAEEHEVRIQFKGSPLEEIRELENKRQSIQADIDSYNMDLGSLTTQVQLLTKESNTLEKAIQNARKEQKKGQLLSTKLDLTQRSADAIADMYQVFADEMRSRIEVKTKEIFKNLVWKDSHFQDIQLGPDFNLEVIDRYGLPARPELSAGERQVLSLSFITAMTRISEEESPLVMDTPFGRLSSQHRESIALYLPELTDQLVLFVTDEELRDQARLNLAPRIGAEYRLNFSTKTSCTTIEEM
jgi:DNA sulfur modification protein DndD